AESLHPGDDPAARTDRKELVPVRQRGRQGQAARAAVQDFRGFPDRAAGRDVTGLQLHHQVILLNGDRKALRHVGALEQRLARLDAHLELARPHRLRIAPGLAGADVELPAVPGAAQKLVGPRQAVVSGPVGLHQRDDAALTERAALVRAAVGEREIFAAEIEDAELAAGRGHDLAAAGRDLARPRDDLTLHERPYNALALSRNTLA